MSSVRASGAACKAPPVRCQRSDAMLAEMHARLVERMPKFMQPALIDLNTLPRNATTQRVRKYELRARGITPTTWAAPVKPR